MWFGFGLMTAILALLLGMRRRLRARWKGVRCSLCDPPQLPYDYLVTRERQKVMSVHIGVLAPDWPNFRIREEGKRDTFFKWLGICEEMQTLDAKFDQRLYLESDAIAIQHLLRQQPTLRDAILQTFDSARTVQLKRFQLRCMNSRLWVEFKPSNEEYLKIAPSQFVPRLAVAANELRSPHLDKEQMVDPFIWRAAALLSTSTAAAVLGGLGLARSLSGRTDILEPWELFVACVPIGLVLTACLLFAVLLMLGRSSRTHAVLIEVAIVGTFGFITGTFALAREANVEFDSSGAERRELQGIRTEHQITHGRRGRKHHHYYLHARDWRANHHDQPLEISIDRMTFERLAGKNAAVITTKQGMLGYEWIELVAAPNP